MDFYKQLQFWIPTIIALSLALWNFRLQKQLMYSKSQLEKQNSRDDLRYKKKLEVYDELWKKLSEVINSLLLVHLDFKVGHGIENKITNQKVTKAVGACMELLTESIKHQPFYSQDVYEQIGEFWVHTSKKMASLDTSPENKLEGDDLDYFFDELFSHSEEIAESIKEEIKEFS